MPNNDQFRLLQPNQHNVIANLLLSSSGSRITLLDETGYGLVLPVTQVDPTTYSFFLPEQLCLPLEPEQHYVLSMEDEHRNILHSERTLIDFPIDPNSENEVEDVLDEEAIRKPLEALADDLGESVSDDSALEDVLDIIAPLPTNRESKTVGDDEIEEIAKSLDREFVGRALWHQIPDRHPAVSDARLALKGKLKALLRGMLSDQ